MKKYLAQYTEVKKQLRHRNQVNYKGTGNRSSDDKIGNDMSGKKRSYTKKVLASSERKVKLSKATRSSTPRVVEKTTLPKSSRKKPIDLIKSDASAPTIDLNQISVDRYHNSYGTTALPVYYNSNKVQQRPDDNVTKQINEIQLKEAELKLLQLKRSIDLQEKENMLRLNKQVC